nr:MAG TPA: hypothetical protein [Caudoviricetes sp.]
MCPLMEMEIEDSLCFDISMVSEGMAPERTVDTKIRKIRDYKEICKRCKYHRND